MPTLPSIWNVPHLRNPNFTGREDLLEKLRTALTSGRPTAVTQAITGMGGVGKTQLATEYAYRYASDYELVWWLRTEEPSTLAADYASLAHELDLPEHSEPDQAVVVAAVQRWLRQHPAWLLVFDNAREPADVRRYLPPGHSGHVLITSRNPGWKAIAQRVTVQVLERQEAVAFLLKRTGQADHAAAVELTAELGGCCQVERGTCGRGCKDTKGLSLSTVSRTHSARGDGPPDSVPLSADLPIGGSGEPVSARTEVVADGAEGDKEALRVLGGLEALEHSFPLARR